MERFILKKYLKELNKDNLILNYEEIEKYSNEKIYGISCNSNDVVKNSIFICKGNNFKEDYLKEAVEKGVIFYLSEIKYDVKVPCILVSNVRKAMSIVSSLFYENAKEDLNIIGITGTKGKSTTAYYIKYILDEYAKENLLHDIGIISSITTYDGKFNDYSLLTTPESIELHSRFYNMKESGIKNVVMEVSSQALKYDRVYGIRYKVGAFLNISEDHISPLEHHDFEDYFSSKLKFFKLCENSCVNLDSDFSDRILNVAKETCKNVVTFSMKDKNASIYAYDIRKDGFSTHFKVKCDRFDREFVLNMPGMFNIENALAAISVAYILDIPERFIYNGLSIAKTEGRMEVYSGSDGKTVIVDYAHNKLSFEKVFESVSKEYNDKEIISVFGCPGNKAVNRRVDLPSVATKFSKKVFITSDDPGDENPEDICREIAKNLNCDFEIIIDRSIAIKKAIEDSSANSIILVLGKGREKLQKMGDKKEKYLSDPYYVKMYLSETPKNID